MLRYILFGFVCLFSCTIKKQEKLFTEAEHLFRIGEYENTIQVLNKIKNYKYCETEYLKGVCYSNLKQYRKAIAHYRKQQNKCPGDFSTISAIANDYKKINMLDSAFFYDCESHKYVPHENPILFNIGMAYYGMNNKIHAIKYFKQHLLLHDSIDFLGFDYLEAALLKEGNYYELIDFIDTLLVKELSAPNYFRILLRQKYVYGDLGEWEIMRSEITKIIENNKLCRSNLINAYYNRYYANYMLGDKKNGCEDYKTLTEGLNFKEIKNFLNCQ